MFNVDEFKSAVGAAGGLLRPSKFVVWVGLPGDPVKRTGMWGHPDFAELATTLRVMPFFCEAAELPGTFSRAVPVRRLGYGPEEPVPLAPSFAPVTLVLNSGADGAVWRFFATWTNIVHNFDQNSRVFNGSVAQDVYETGYKADYRASVSVSSFSDRGDEVRRVYLNEAFPSALQAADLNWSPGAAPEKVVVTVSYWDWFEGVPDIKIPTEKE